jgi:hypothetical protein
LQSPANCTEADLHPGVLLYLPAQLLKGGVRRCRNPGGQLPQLVSRELRVCPTAMGQGGDIPALTFLAQQLINEGFMHLKQCGDLPFASDLPLHSLNYAFSQVDRVGSHGIIKGSSIYSFKCKPL